MNEIPGKSRVIPLKAMEGVDSGTPVDLTRRLEQDGWIRQSTIGEPRLSEIVRTYERLGYEVRVEENQESGAGGSACSSGAASGCSGGGTTGCSGGGCSSGNAPVSASDVPVDEDASDLRTVFVRKIAWSSN